LFASLTIAPHRLSRLPVVPSACPIEDSGSTHHLVSPSPSRFSFPNLDYVIDGPRFFLPFDLLMRLNLFFLLIDDTPRRTTLLHPPL
jgi:hypothetical protein